MATIYWWLPAALFVAFSPVAVALIQGQDSIILLTFFTGSFVLLQRKHELWAGVLIGLALFKFQLAIPIALLFLFWRRWHFSAGLAISATAALIVSILLVGSAQMNIYAQSLLSISVNATRADYLRNAIAPSNMPNFRGLVFGLANHHLTNFSIQALVAVSSIILLIWISLQTQFRRGSEALAVAITASTLLSYHLFIHDLAILLVPLAWALNRYAVSEPDGSTAEKAISRAGVLALCAPLIEFFFPHHIYLISLATLGFLISICRQRGNASGAPSLQISAL